MTALSCAPRWTLPGGSHPPESRQSRLPMHAHLAFQLPALAVLAALALTRTEAAPLTGTFLDRPSTASVRLVTYNVYWDSIFARVNPARAAGFARVAAALDPDIWAFQELGSINSATPGSSTAELQSLLNTLQPTPAGWQVWKNNSLAIASRQPPADLEHGFERCADRRQRPPGDRCARRPARRGVPDRPVRR